MSSSYRETGEPTVDEARDALVRALLRDPDAEYVAIYSRFQGWLLKSAEIGVVHGWLSPGELHEFDEQSSEMRYKITDVGRAQLGAWADSGGPCTCGQCELRQSIEKSIDEMKKKLDSISCFRDQLLRRALEPCASRALESLEHRRMGWCSCSSGIGHSVGTHSYMVWYGSIAEKLFGNCADGAMTPCWSGFARGHKCTEGRKP